MRLCRQPNPTGAGIVREHGATGKPDSLLYLSPGVARIGDEGSGMMIGRTAVRRAIWALEQMAPMTPLAACANG